ncbi:hypothetical protein CNR22_22705 [Sphingobacteriaceae bacterium]|nr:hypothetical protein CNR22_22705 [Sphingobacteriaceae bacterium]
MSFEEEFDSIIRRKAEGESYPFDESNWEKTSALLDAERNTTRALKIKQLYLPVVLVLAIGTAGLMTYNYFDSVKGTTQTAKELAVVAKADIATSNNENKITVSSSKLKTTSLDDKKQNDESTNTIANNASQNTSEITKAVVVKSAAEKTHMAAISKEKNTSTNQETALKIKESNLPLSTTTSKEEKSKAENQNGERQEKLAERSENIMAVEPANAKEATNFEASNKSASTELPEITSENSRSEADNSYVIPASAAPSASDLNQVVNADQLSAVYSTLPFEVSDQEINSGPFVYLNRYDDEYYKKKNAKTHYLDIEFGANYLLGWNAAKGKDGDGMNWYAGLNYGRYLSNKFNVSIGLQAYNIANIKQPFYLVAAKEYGFGSNLIYTRVTSNELYYLAVPLKFNYMINRKNSIGLGVNAAYLIGATNTVSKYYTLDNEVRTVGPSDTQTKGIYKGTNTMNIMLTANYKTQLVKRVGLNLEFNYGVSDMFKNTDQVKTSEVPMGIRVGLTYAIFDK